MGSEAAKVKSKSGRVQDRNLVPGFKSGVVTIETDGLRRLSFLMGQAVEDLENDLLAKHTRRIGDVTRIARRLFEQDTRRPTSKGDRPGDRTKRRKTGTFTFGARSGGAFVGVDFSKDPVKGFGYPNIEVADAKTQGIWRVLEFGLGAKATRHELAPTGEHLLPLRFGFDPNKKGRRDAKLFPVRGPAARAGAGILAKNEGKGFIRPAVEEVRDRFLPKDYKDAARLFAQHFS